MNQGKFWVYGSGTFAKLVRDLGVELGHGFKGFLDDFNPDQPEVIGPSAILSELDFQAKVAIGIGYNSLQKRLECIRSIISKKAALLTLVHPTAYLHPSVQLEDGVVIMARAVIDRGARIGLGTVVWPGTNVSHDVVVEENCFLSPSVTICGFTTVGHSTFVGAGAVIADKRTVPANSFIKANSLFK